MKRAKKKGKLTVTKKKRDKLLNGIKKIEVFFVVLVVQHFES